IHYSTWCTKRYADIRKIKNLFIKGDIMMVKMILDLDTGVDDGMALAYAIGSKEIDLIGVTGTFGNVYTEDGVQNVMNILHMCNVSDIPVYAGESNPINGNRFTRLEVSARIHGENGVGQVEIETSPKEKETKS